MKKIKCKIISLLLSFALLFSALIFGLPQPVKDVHTTHAETTNNSYSMPVSGSYQTADNKGYYPSKAERYDMSFGSATLGNLQISGVQSQGTYDGKNAYSIDTGSQVNVKYTLNYSKNSINNSVWNISSDSATSVNGISLNKSSVGKGCVILEKKNLAEDSYTTLLKEGNVFASKDNYEITSLNGDDINNGCYYRLTVAYEIYRSWKVKKGWWIFKKTVTETEYKNCLEIYEFFIGRNTCKVQLLDLSSKDYSAYSTDEAQIELIKKGDTLQNGSVATNGFQINYLDNKSYKVEYSRNGAKFVSATDKQEITQNGKYDVRVTSLFGNSSTTTIYVFNGGTDKGYATYFGDTIFQGKKITDLSVALPTYQTGVKIRLNGVGNNIPQLRGEIVNQQTQVVTKIQPSAVEQVIELNAEGVYTISLSNMDESLAGTFYAYDFAFIVSNKSTYPSINRNNIIGSYLISDYDTKHIEVAYVMDSGKTAYVCFDKNDYDDAYQFAYAVEKKYITTTDLGYLYNNKEFASNFELVEEMNSVVLSKLTYQYFTKALDNFYIDNDSVGVSIKLDNLNYDRDIYVSTSLSIGRMLNRENIVDGNFKFVQAGLNESASIIATNVDTNEVVKLKYNTKLSKMLSKTGKYLITETNCYGESVEYFIVYACTNETVLTLDVDDVKVDVNRNNYQVVSGTKIKIDSITNNFDSDGVVVVANLTTKEVVLNDYEDAINQEFETDSYLISMFDRSGNVYSVVLNCGDIEVSGLKTLIESVKNENSKIYNYVLNYGVANSCNEYRANA